MSQSIRINTGINKESSRTRTVCAAVMGTQAPQSALYKDTPTVKAACDSMIKAGEDLAGADEAVQVAVSALRNARKARKSKLEAFDNAYNVCVAQVEQHATSPEEVTALALTVLERQNHPHLASPLAVEATFLVAKGIVRVRVTLPPGVKTCLLEMSTTPTDPASFRRMPGNGKLRTFSGYAPGTYHFRAASVRSDEESAPTLPVSVLVK